MGIHSTAMRGLICIALVLCCGFVANTTAASEPKTNIKMLRDLPKEERTKFNGYLHQAVDQGCAIMKDTYLAKNKDTEVVVYEPDGSYVMGFGSQTFVCFAHFKVNSPEVDEPVTEEVTEDDAVTEAVTEEDAVTEDDAVTVKGGSIVAVPGASRGGGGGQVEVFEGIENKTGCLPRIGKLLHNIISKLGQKLRNFIKRILGIIMPSKTHK